MSSFTAHRTLRGPLVLANRSRLLKDVHTSGEPFQRLADLLRCVEALGLLEDVFASEETLHRLGDLLGGVEGLGLLEDVLASEKTVDGLAHLLAARNPVRIQWAGAGVVNAGDGSVADGAHHY